MGIIYLTIPPGKRRHCLIEHFPKRPSRRFGYAQPQAVIQYMPAAVVSEVSRGFGKIYGEGIDIDISKDRKVI